MAIVNKQVLGKVSGAVGDVVFRQKDGKSFVGVRPGSFIPGSDPASLDRRSRFSLTARYAQQVNSVEALQTFWKRVKLSNMSAFNYILSENYPFIQPDDITSNIKLAPGIGFSVTTTSVGLTPSQVQVVLDPLGAGSGINPAVETSIRMAALLYLNTPLDEYADPDAFVTLQSDPQASDISNPLTFTIALNSQQSQLLTSYQSRTGYYVLFTTDAEEVPVRYSQTFS